MGVMLALMPYVEGHGETERDTDKHTDRHTDRQRQTDIHTYRHTEAGRQADRQTEVIDKERGGCALVSFRVVLHLMGVGLAL